MQVTAPENQPRSRRRTLLFAMAGVLAMVTGLLVPVVQAQAAEFGKPKVTVSAVSGAAALKVSWNGQKNSKGSYATTYRVFYGTSSSKSKAKSVDVNLTKAGNHNRSTANPVYVLNNLSTKKTYYVWVQAWNGKAVGDLSSSAKKKTSGFSYSAPPSITAVNAGKDFVELSWRTVTGAPTYRVKAVGGGQTLYAHSDAEGTMVVQGLKPKTKYTFTVSVEQPPVSGTPGYVKMSKESKAKASKTTLSASLLDAPTGLTTRDDPKSSTDKDGQRPYTIDLSWLAPIGFDPTKDRFQVDYATTQDMKSGAGSFRLQSGTAVGRVPSKTGWGYFVTDSQATVMAPMIASAQEKVPTVTAVDEASEAPLAPSTTPSVPPTSTPAPETPATPSPTVPTESAPAPETTAPETPAPTEPSVPAETTPAAESTGDPTASTEPPEAEQLSLPAAPNRTAQRYWARIFNLNSNKNLYLRIKVISADGTVKSERTTALMAKTLSPKGYITGRVILPKGVSASQYVVAAYKSKDLHAQADLNSKGEYVLEVRPGSYYVQAIYIGSGNYNTRFAAANPKAGRTRSDGASKVTVEVAKQTKAKDINPQSTASYVISGDVDCPDGESRCDVDVAAMIGSKVVEQDRSDSNGKYQIKGLPAGTYTLRISHAEPRFKTKTVGVQITNKNETRNTTLVERDWIRTYKVKVTGSKRAGSTLKVTNKDWLASELPVRRADKISFQWYRGDAKISGATKRSYKLTSADRGKSIRVRITYDRVGFVKDTVTSKAYRIG